MNPDDKLLYQIALTCIRGVGGITARHLLSLVDDVCELFAMPKTQLSRLPGITPLLVESITDKEVLEKAARERDFVLENDIVHYFITDESYPYRLRECCDAPLIFYYKGNANLDALKIVSIVGTRKITPYGTEMTESIIEGLKELGSDLLIVSGLAYGIDVCAHRAALKNNIDTVGVLAHGLDRIYPSLHRHTANEMLDRGGLLTEFPSKTEPDKANFVRRNRIIAGLADLVIVAESARKGGSMITAEIAASYSREVFAVPGRSSDENSQGCNFLIRTNRAGLITNAADLLEAMSWDAGKRRKHIQPQLPLAMNEDEELIIRVLAKEETQINSLLVQTDLTINRLSPVLFEMEMRGVVRCLPGGFYKLN